MRLLTRAHHNAPRVCTSVLSRLFCRLPLVGMEKLQAALLVFLGSVSTLIAGASVLYVNCVAAKILPCLVGLNKH